LYRVCDVYREVNKALDCDENGQTTEALVSYKKGAELITGALAIELLASADSEVNSKRDKLKTALDNAKSRIAELEPPLDHGEL